MRSSHTLDRLDTAFDDDRLVADAGLLLPATLAQHMGLKALVMSALAGGDCIDCAFRRNGHARSKQGGQNP